MCEHECVNAVVYICVPPQRSLKAEPSSIVGHRELTEHRQTFAAAVVGAAAGFRAAERAGRAASILVPV